MKQFSRRIWLAAILMTCGWVFTTWVRSGYTFDVQPLARGLDTLPMELDGYRAIDLPMDEEISKVLNADAVVNRDYRRPNGTSVVVHASAWVRPETVASVAPHIPKVCYTNAGWKILEERGVDVATPAGNLPLWVVLFERDGERCVVSYWYQMGQSTFNSPQEARQIHRELWGKKHWPATVKFMLQVPAQGIDAALPQIEEFASNVFQWASKL
jgi:EpsI family protein